MLYFTFFSFFFLKTGFSYAAQADFKLMVILLPLVCCITDMNRIAWICCQFKFFMSCKEYLNLNKIR